MALDRGIQSKINEVVSAWTDEGRMFTAFEVSLNLKEQGVRERHRNLRDHVHQAIFTLGGPKDYSRTLMDVGAPEQAWVYHPQTSSPYRYRPLDRTGHSALPPDDPNVAVPALRRQRGLVWGSAAQAGVPPGAYGTDQRGRVCIPVTLLHAIGAGAGERVRVQCAAGQEQLTIEAEGEGDGEGASADTSYTVEPDGNVRLTQATLEKAGIGGLQCYRIAGDSSRITVRAFEE
ncbi:MAG: hypothetical protein JNM56_23240 [Planctomycetia bacterium]|nr:hypothetical protein [Planctomycetia bacterium]